MSLSLLVRETPVFGESLSSFRQRVWSANGYNLFPVFDPELRRSDPDLQRSDAVYRIISTRVGLPVEGVRGLTLWDHPLLDSNSGHNRPLNPRWIVPLRYGSFGKGAGSMVCARTRLCTFAKLGDFLPISRVTHTVAD